MEGKKLENIQIEVSPGSLATTVEEQIIPPLNSLGTVSPQDVEIVVKINFPDQNKKAILRWDYEKKARLRITQVGPTKKGKITKIISWENAEHVAKVLGTFEGAREKVKES
jgi:hypothetical protein